MMTQSAYTFTNPQYRAALDQFIANPQVMIEITSICNFACTYCLSPHKVRKKVLMEPELFHHIARQLPSLTTRAVRLHIDGEPTSHPRFSEYASAVNEHNLPIELATNGSLLKTEYLSLWINMLISMSTNADELARRHNKLQFEKYIDNIRDYTAAWARADCRQNLSFQIVYYHWIKDAEFEEYNAKKNKFIAEFVQHTGVTEYCEQITPIDSLAPRWRKRKGRGSISFIKQSVSGGGLYPVDGKLLDGPKTAEGFCDSPWKRLTIQSDGTISCCCVDLSGGTAFTNPSEIWEKPLTEIWAQHAGIQAQRSGFLDGRVEREVCKTCLGRGAIHQHYVAPGDFPIPTAP